VSVFPRSIILRLCAAAGAVISVFAASSATAQTACPTPSVLVAWPKAPDRKLALELRDKTISAVKDAFGKDLCPVPGEQVTAWLSRSRYPTDSALPTRDWIQLANVLRADEILELSAKPAGKGYEISGRLTLVRDESVRDSLPTIAIASNMSQAAKLAMTELKRLRTMLSQEAKCYRAGRDGNFAAAEAAGRAALAAYPGNIARLCLATALRQGKKSPDEVIALSQAVRKTDPDNGLALLHLLNTYYDRSDTTRYAEIGTAMISIDPASQFAETIIANLASWKRTDAALTLLAQSLENDPENVNLRQIEFRLIYSSDNFKEAQQKGEELAKLDTASVDTAFVLKMVSAYVRDSQPQPAMNWLIRGTEKFPENVSMAMALAQTLSRAGQHQRAVAEYQRVLRINPDARGIRLYISNAFNEMGQADSAVAWARRAAESGDDKAQASGVVVQIGSKLFTAAQQTRAVDDYMRVIPFVAYADSLNENLTARFVWGASAFGVASQMLQAMQPPAGQPTCAALRDARVWVVTANQMTLAGARSQPQAAPQILEQTGQWLEYIDQNFAALRCGSGNGVG
jgi:tetratricopeptide (TPR) repeat protein